MNWLEKLGRGLAEHAGEDVKNKVMAGSEDFASTSTAEEWAAWVKGALQRLEAAIPDDDVRMRVLSGCACEFPREHIDKMREKYEAGASVDEVLELMREANARNDVTVYPPFVAEGEALRITKVPFDREGYEKTTGAEVKKSYYCHCPVAKSAGYEMARSFCYCGGGWFAQLWEGILGKAVRVELVKSIVAGDDVCEFIVRLPEM